MMDSLRKLSRRLIASFPLMRYFGGHIEYGDTNDCPGSELIPYMAELRDELKLSVPIKRSLR